MIVKYVRGEGLSTRVYIEYSMEGQEQKETTHSRQDATTQQSGQYLLGWTFSQDPPGVWFSSPELGSSWNIWLLREWFDLCMFGQI